LPKNAKNAKKCQIVSTFGNHLAIWHFLALFGIFWQLGILLEFLYIYKIFKD